MCRMVAMPINFEWICPYCEAKNFSWIPSAAPGRPCPKCGEFYYLGKLLDEEVETIDDIPKGEEYEA